VKGGSRTATAFSCAYDGEGNIIRSIDILAGKTYNYLHKKVASTQENRPLVFLIK